jgi:DNA-binding transcriptional regulator YiaG
MTPTQIKQARSQLGLTQRGLETALNLKGHDGRTVRMWEAGDREISGPCSKLIEIFLEYGIR